MAKQSNVEKGLKQLLDKEEKTTVRKVETDDIQIRPGVEIRMAKKQPEVLFKCITFRQPGNIDNIMAENIVALKARHGYRQATDAIKHAVNGFIKEEDHRKKLEVQLKDLRSRFASLLGHVKQSEFHRAQADLEAAELEKMLYGK